MNEREDVKLSLYHYVVQELYKLFDKVWCKKFEIEYLFVSTLPQIYEIEKSWDCLIKDVVTDMCHADDWYLCDKYIDIVGGNWQRSLFELVGMFIRIKVGE